MQQPRTRQTRALVIAGTHSGVGKTTVATALMAAFRRRRLKVQAFKVGPDFIDPGFHQAASGRPSRNLDGWMMGKDACIQTFCRASRDADISIIEGVMGLFDGASATSESGSTAEMAKCLGAPVVLVIDASALARSAAAVVNGFENFDPDLAVAAVVANSVAGEGHYRYINQALEAHCRAKPLGWLSRDAAIHFPERHLGLVTAAESLRTTTLDKLAAMAEQSIDLDRLFDLSLTLTPSGSPQTEGRSNSAERPGQTVRIGVAHDRALCFYYQDNLDFLETCGAELVYWSPLQDSLPQGLDGLYFGGGYPELYAEQLSANTAARFAVAQFVERGGPVYAECGGLMYLAEAIVTTNGKAFPMVGVFPTRCRMLDQISAIGYVEVTAHPVAPFLATDCTARGHQFRYSEIDPMPDHILRCYEVRPAAGSVAMNEGYLVSNCLGSYAHLHFSSCPAFAESWVDLARSR